MTKAIVKKACALKRDSASDKLLRNVLDDICNKLDTAKKSSNNGKVPYGEAQKLVEEMPKILPKLNRNMVNYHLKKRESMATTTYDDEEPDLPGLDYGTDNEESDDEGNENTSIITTSPVLVEIFSNPTLPCPRRQLVITPPTTTVSIADPCSRSTDGISVHDSSANNLGPQQLVITTPTSTVSIADPCSRSTDGISVHDRKKRKKDTRKSVN
jgi:hypothetical protein